ncbi:hypothetical protein CCR75_002487 [Bremia lactucae]|uniref:Uncharacterized protein n=1 Tax=Bremia lactucae TaxID=4779 RepID=A0A976FRX6_BRELC|nr:hypothetical protein CCR75_002487 [Bremia lactucae]
MIFPPNDHFFQFHHSMGKPSAHHVAEQRDEYETIAWEIASLFREKECQKHHIVLTIYYNSDLEHASFFDEAKKYRTTLRSHRSLEALLGDPHRSIDL